MATVIQIKRSQSTNVPASLANGEFAYSFSNDKLFIGQTDTAGSPTSVEAVGGKYYTDILAAAHGTTTANSALIVDTNKHISEVITTSLKLTTSGGSANGMVGVQNDSSMAAANTTTLATSKSIKNYVDTQVAGVSSSISLAGDTGTDTYSTGQTLTFSGGTGLDSAITDNQVTFNITAGGVGTTQLADAAVTGAKVANLGLGSNTIAAGAITHSKLGLQSVTIGTISANTLVLESEGINSNDNDTTIPTSAAVKDLADEYLQVANTAALVQPYLQVANVAGYLTPYLEVANTGALVQPYLQVANVAAYLTPYLQVANASFSATDGSTSTNITPGSTLTIQGTANEVTVGESSGTFTVGLPDDVTIAGQLTVSENLNVSGNLVVDGTLTYLNTTNLAVQDPLIKLANNNTADTIDIGFYGKYATTKSAGLFRDATDGKFRLFHELTADPTTTVNTGGAGYAAATLVIGALELGTDLAVADGGTGAGSFTSNGILYGNGTSALQVTAAGAQGKVLQAGSGGTPEFGDLDGGTF